jgi:enoyl-CoA hydratase
MTQQLDVQVVEGVCRVTFCRPEAYNALTEEMAAELIAALVDAAEDHAVRVVLITGTGAAFSAGADLDGDDPIENFGESSMDGAHSITRWVTGLDKPVVVAVNGIAAGVGASLCFAADLAVAKESASFLMAFSRIGLMPDGGATLTVAAAVGRVRAMRMALLAETVTAREAYQAGLVSHVVPDEEFERTVEEIVGRLASGPPIAFAATKKAVNAATIGELEAALARERSGQLELFKTADAAEGMRAFAQKRRPSFTGR